LAKRREAKRTKSTVTGCQNMIPIATEPWAKSTTNSLKTKTTERGGILDVKRRGLEKKMLFQREKGKSGART